MEGSAFQRPTDGAPAGRPARAPWAGRTRASASAWRLGLAILVLGCCTACVRAGAAPLSLRAPSAQSFWSLRNCFGGPPRVESLGEDRAKASNKAVPLVRRVKKMHSMFEAEESDVSDLDEAEKAYKCAEQAKRKVPVTGNSETESALEMMVQQYMGRIQMQMNKAASRAVSAKGGARGGAKEKAAKAKSARQLEEEEEELMRRWQEEEALLAAQEQAQYERDLALLAQEEQKRRQEQQAHAHAAPAAPKRYPSSFSSDSRDDETLKEGQQEQAWRDAVLRACMPLAPHNTAKEAAPSTDAAAARRGGLLARLRVQGLKEKAKTKARLLLESARESARAGRAKAMALLRAAKHEQHVGEMLHRLRSVVRGAGSAVERRRRALSGVALETIFVALAVLADGVPASSAANVDLDGWEKGCAGHVGREGMSVREALRSFVRVIPGAPDASGGGRGRERAGIVPF